MSHPPASTAPETATSQIAAPQTAAPEANPRHSVSVDPVISVVVAATRDLNDAAAAQLLHWCEARLHLLTPGRAGSATSCWTSAAPAVPPPPPSPSSITPVTKRRAGMSGSTSWAPDRSWPPVRSPSATVSAGGAPIRPSMPRGPRWIHQQAQIVPAAVPSIRTRSCSHRSPRTIVSDSGDLHTDPDTSWTTAANPYPCAATPGGDSRPGRRHRVGSGLRTWRSARWTSRFRFCFASTR